MGRTELLSEEDTITTKGPEAKNYWLTKKAVTEYAGVSGNRVISDITVYEYIAKKLQYADKVVLDVGSFLGFSTVDIAKRGATHVRGIDDKLNFIGEATKLYANQKNVSFRLSQPNEPIELVDGTQGYDIAVATFVHPTISTKKVLSDLIARIGAAVVPGGKFVLLGLHPKSFGDYSFVSYQHQLYPGTNYEDEQPFPNKLIKNDGTVLEFDDYCWTSDTLQRMLADGGFQSTEVLDIQYDLLPQKDTEFLQHSIEILSKIYPQIKESDEFQNVPLFQLFVATK